MIERKPSWKTLKSTIKYETPWIKVVHNDVLTPANTKGIYGCVHFQNIAVGVIALDPELNTYIVQQYRYPLKKYSWEIPEGGSPLNVPPLETAKKELKEETGISAKNWQLIQELDLSNSATDEVSFTYLATDLSFSQMQLEDTEDIIVKKLPFNSFFKMIEKGEIRDAISVAAGYKIKMMLDNDEIKY